MNVEATYHKGNDSAVGQSQRSARRALQFGDMVTGIEHTAIASPDPHKLAQWYVDHLGFVINYQSARSKTCFIKAPDGFLFGISEAAPETKPTSGMKAAGLRHLALSVADFPGVHATLVEKGVNFLTDVQKVEGNTTVFFLDADGNILHLLHRETPLP